MILVIDNYDSFVHNLARYFRQLGLETKTLRNDAVTIEEIETMAPQAIVISPGPCTPDEAGVSLNVVTRLAGRIPIFGVCLGHQAIVQAFGGSIIRPEPMHGRSSKIEHDSDGVFAGVQSPLTVGRYHSLVADTDSLPDCLTVTARCGDLVMAVEHKSAAHDSADRDSAKQRAFPVVGVQFHPESVLTDSGCWLISNFLTLAGIEHDVSKIEQSAVSTSARLQPAEDLESRADLKTAPYVIPTGDRL